MMVVLVEKSRNNVCLSSSVYSSLFARPTSTSAHVCCDTMCTRDNNYMILHLVLTNLL